MDELSVGLTGERNATVLPELTARYMGSGGLDVYATPAMIALMEAAAVAAIEHLLPEGQASVGIAVDVEHLSATPVGEQVRAQAEIIDIEGRRVTFEVRAWDDSELIGEGTHTRFVIDLERFMSRLKQSRAEE